MSQRTEDAASFLGATSFWQVSCDGGPAGAQGRQLPKELDELELEPPAALLFGAVAQDARDAVEFIDPPPELCLARPSSPRFGGVPLVPMPPSPDSSGDELSASPSPRLRDELELEPEPYLADLTELLFPTCPYGSPSTDASDASPRTPPFARWGTSGPAGGLTVHLLGEAATFAWMRQHLRGPLSLPRGRSGPPTGGDVSFDVVNEAGLRSELVGLLELGYGGTWLPPAAPRAQALQLRCAPELAERLTDELLSNVQRHFTGHYYARDAKGRHRSRDCGPLAWELGHMSVAERAARARLDHVHGGPLLELLGGRKAHASMGGPDGELQLGAADWRDDLLRLLRPDTLEALHQGLFASGSVQLVRDGWAVTLGEAPRRRQIALIDDADASYLRLRLGWTHEGPQRWRLQDDGCVAVQVDGALFVGLGIEMMRVAPKANCGSALAFGIGELWLAWEAALGGKKGGKSGLGPLADGGPKRHVALD